MAKSAPASAEIEPVDPVPVEAVPPWGNWLYAGPPNTTWTHIPLTAHPGDVLTWPESPGPGWEPTDAAATVRPDNWRPDPDESSADTDPVPPAGDIN